MNFVFYNPDYHNFNCLPDWAKKTLLEHEKDKRDYLYLSGGAGKGRVARSLLECRPNGNGSPGKMQGYMRMYWGKKILEWVQDPREAFEIALYLNNK